MSKSTPSTTTQINQNPVGQMQAGYLQNLYNSATAASGIMPGDTPAGQGYLNQIQNLAGNNANATSWLGGLPSMAGNAFQAMLTGGMPQGNYAAGPQIGQLTGGAQNPINTGLYFANQMGGAAASAPGAVAPYQSALSGLAGQYGGLTGAGYGSYGALNNLAGAAAQGGQNALGTMSGLGAGALGAGQSALGAFGGLAGNAMNVANPSINSLYANAGMGISGNPIYNSLMGMASGQYVDPSRNPALQGTIQAATDPLVRQYQTATAPQTDSGFEAGGRYGSGAHAVAQGQNQYGLGQALATTNAGIVNNAYNTGLNSMLGAGQAIGSAYNTGMANSNQALASAGQLGQSGVNLAGNLLGQGYGQLQQGYQNAGNLYGSGYGMQNQGYGTAGNLYGAGAGALNSLAGTGLGGASSNYNQAGQLGLSGLNTFLQGMGGAAGAANAGYGTGGNWLNEAGQLANTGQISLGGIAQAAPELANYPLSQLSTAFNSTWAPIQNLGAILGSPIGGNTMTQQTTPMYQNWGQQAITGLQGIGALAGIFGV